jgi:hypothetical protein
MIPGRLSARLLQSGNGAGERIELRSALVLLRIMVLRVKSHLLRFEIGDQSGNRGKCLSVRQLTPQIPKVFNSPVDFSTLGAHAGQLA